MKLGKFLEIAGKYDPELNLELTKVLFLSQKDDGPVEVTLDFPIIGITDNEGDLYLMVDPEPEVISFGKKMRRLDGSPVSKKDVGL